MLSVAPDGALEYASATARELLDCASDEALRRRWETLRPRLVGDAAAHGVRTNPVVRLAEAGGGWSLRFECHAVDTGAAGWLVLVRNRRAVDDLETELLLASRMRAQPYEQRVLAHDLKSPLNTMQLSLELLADALAEDDGMPAAVPSRERRLRHVGILREELARLNAILQSALEAREPLGTAAAPFDLREPVREIARLLVPQARRQRVDVDVQMPDAAVPAFGYRERLRQALLNVASASLEGMPEGGRLSLALENGPSSVVTVSDTGRGLPQPVLDGLYRTYYAGTPDAGDVRLYAARLTVESHGGEFEAGSVPGQGTRYRISLPPSGDTRV